MAKSDGVDWDAASKQAKSGARDIAQQNNQPLWPSDRTNPHPWSEPVLTGTDNTPDSQLDRSSEQERSGGLEMLASKIDGTVDATISPGDFGDETPGFGNLKSSLQAGKNRKNRIRAQNKLKRENRKRERAGLSPIQMQAPLEEETDDDSDEQIRDVLADFADRLERMPDQIMETIQAS